MFVEKKAQADNFTLDETAKKIIAEGTEKVKSYIIKFTCVSVSVSVCVFVRSRFENHTYYRGETF